ncbi:hypothetical protein PS2_039704 [Malus domestica]
MALTLLLHGHRRKGVRFMSVHSESIYASMRRASMVGCEVQPHCVDKARHCRVQDIECLCIAFLKVISKFSQANFYMDFWIIPSSQPPRDPAVLGALDLS